MAKPTKPPKDNIVPFKKTVTWVSDAPEDFPPFKESTGPLPPITPTGVPRYMRPSDVPISLWANVRAAGQRGMSGKEIAVAFAPPFDWVDGFIRLSNSEPGLDGDGI